MHETRFKDAAVNKTESTIYGKAGILIVTAHHQIPPQLM